MGFPLKVNNPFACIWLSPTGADMQHGFVGKRICALHVNL